MRKRGFTLIELLVVISIIALLIGILLPALGAARRTARQMQNSTQVRGIHSALVLYSQGNNTYYPGFNTSGTLLATSLYGGSGGGVGGRFQELLDDNYFTGEYVVSPSETKTPWTGTSAGFVGSSNYSYALLEISEVGQRRNEWRDTSNSEAPVLSDRGIVNGTGLKSVHTNPANNTYEWRGSVGWNDNHVSFESDHLVVSKYGSARIDQDGTSDNDNLFKADNNAIVGSSSAFSGRNSDSFMVWYLTDDAVN